MPEAIFNLANKIKAWKARARHHERRVSRVSQFRYASFKELLASYTELLNIISDIEEKLREQAIFGMSYIRSQSTRAVFHTLRMLKSFDDLSGQSYLTLFDVPGTDQPGHPRGSEQEKGIIGLRVGAALFPNHQRHGGLGRREECESWRVGQRERAWPSPKGLPSPHAHVISFSSSNALGDEISRIRRNLDPHDTKALNKDSEQIRRLIMLARVPEELEEAILSAYDDMVVTIRQKGGEPKLLPSVALRSTAMGKDGEHSHTGQYVSIFNVKRDRIIQTYKHILAGLYTARAISYRLNKGMQDEDLDMTVGCIEMVQSVCSGMVHSWNASDLSSDTILINAVWGLEPYALGDIVSPDSYVVAKDQDLTILRTTCSHKSVQLVADEGGGLSESPVDAYKHDTLCLSPEQVKTWPATPQHWKNTTSILRISSGPSIPSDACLCSRRGHSFWMRWKRSVLRGSRRWRGILSWLRPGRWPFREWALGRPFTCAPMRTSLISRRALCLLPSIPHRNLPSQCKRPGL